MFRHHFHNSRGIVVVPQHIRHNQHRNKQTNNCNRTLTHLLSSITTTTTTTPTIEYRTSSRSSIRIVANDRRRRREYHELSYEGHGKPWSCIEYSAATSTTSSDDKKTSEMNQVLLEAEKVRNNHDAIRTENEDRLYHHHQQQQQQVWVHVELIAAPYNPADALSIQGMYANPYQQPQQLRDGDDQTKKTNPYETIAQISSRSSSCCSSGGGSTSRRTVPGSEGWGRIIDIIDESTEVPDVVCRSGTTTVGATDTVTPGSTQPHDDELLQIGDYVTLGQPGLGTFRSNLWLPRSSVIQLHRGQELYDMYGPTVPAPLFQTAGTAIRMLRDFLPSPSTTTTIIQNAGNSAVGLMVSQLATKLMNYNCISIVRSNHRTVAQMEELQQYMMEYGNPSSIVTEESIGTTTGASMLLNDPPQCNNTPFEPTTLMPTTGNRLGLNAVGGDSIRSLVQMMMTATEDTNYDSNSPTNTPPTTIVTYGNMSKQPHLPIDPALLIFQNMNFTGFWYSRWMVQQQYQQYLQHHHRGSSRDSRTSSTNNNSRNSNNTNGDARAVMMNEIVDAVLAKQLKCPPVQSYPLSDYKRAFEQQRQQQQNNIKSKAVFDCRET